MTTLNLNLFEEQEARFAPLLEERGYIWVIKGETQDKNALFIRARADFKRDLVGVGSSWQECFEDILSQIGERR